MLERLTVDQAAERTRRLAESRAPAAPRSRRAARARTARRRAASPARRSAPAGSRSAIASTSTSGNRRRRLGEMRGQRPAGQEEHFQRADDAASRSRGWMRAADAGSTRAQHPMQKRRRRGASAIRSSRARSAASRPGPGKQPARQRAVVEAGAADQDRQRGRARGCRGSPRAASRAYCAAVYSSVGSTMSIR